MSRKAQIWLVVAFIVVIAAVTIVAAISSQGAQQAAAPAFTTTQTSAIAATDHTKGSTSPKVTVIEYGDFQCPACGAYEPLVEQLETAYAGQPVQFVFRNFPLFQIHQDAMIAAQAAEAANLQGKYWQMHDLLYKNQSTWSTEPAATVISKYFDGYAQSIGLNVSTFDTDINSTAVKQKVQNDLALGNAASVDHTPTFFINLVQIPNPTSLAEFQSDINAALASSTVK